VFGEGYNIAAGECLFRKPFYLMLWFSSFERLPSEPYICRLCVDVHWPEYNLSWIMCYLWLFIVISCDPELFVLPDILCYAREAMRTDFSGSLYVILIIDVHCWLRVMQIFDRIIGLCSDMSLCTATHILLGNSL